jgi:ATP-dependent Lon protease
MAGIDLRAIAVAASTTSNQSTVSHRQLLSLENFMNLPNDTDSAGAPGNGSTGAAAETTVPVLPLTTGVVLPGMVVTVALETPEAIVATDAALAHERMLLLVPKSEGRLASVGALSRIETVGELPDGRRALVIRAVDRAHIGAGVMSPGSDSALWVRVDRIGDPIPSHRVEAVNELAREYRAVAEMVAEKRGWGRIGAALANIDSPSELADTVAEWPELSHERRVELLETIVVEARLQLVIGWLREELAEQELKDKLRRDVSEGMEKQQREYMLRQQLSAIRKELGEDGDADSAVESFRTRLAELTVPDVTRTAIAKEIDRYERTSEQSPEHGWIRSWLDTVFDIPWGTQSQDHLDVSRAREVLDQDTTGLNEAKERILEWLAVRSLRAEAAARSGTDEKADTGGGLMTPRRRGEGAIMVLVGPPGVGKTSLGESVARALGRSYVRMALGGVRDEAEIRGHRRTYVGAQPGRLVRALREAGSMNPVILLDEVDKLATGWSGDPAAALLEVLDPAQNHTFRDHYLEIDLDLSNVVFLATANTLESIPGPLLDRLELINVDGYVDSEKVQIARNHLLPKLLEQHGMTQTDVEISDDALLAIVEGYTREAGVRGLERQLAKVLRKVAIRVSSRRNPMPEPHSMRITNEADVIDLLGRPKRIPEEVSDRVAVPGVATGLAVTGVGGDVLFVETAVLDSEPISKGDPGTDSISGIGSTSGRGDTALTITGQLGDVMKESAAIALSYIRSNARALGIDAGDFLGKRVHVHFPAGAVPKDGPSAGITMTTALISLLTGRTVRPDVAMTGEITLHGRVLPIGGVKQKLLAAHRAGITTVIIPKRNEADLDDVPEQVRSQLSIFPVSDFSEVLTIALAGANEPIETHDTKAA